VKLIGLSGKMGSGKDTVYNYVLRPRGWKRWSFAHGLKAAGLGMGFSLEEVTVTKPDHVRKWLQHYGTEEHREKYHTDFWVRAAGYWLHVLERDLGVERVVFTDVRFPNEAAFIRQQGGKLVRVYGRTTPDQPEEIRNHPSETALDLWTEWDCELFNGDGVSPPNLGIELMAKGII
jgi:hypothetical protein